MGGEKRRGKKNEARGVGATEGKGVDEEVRTSW